MEPAKWNQQLQFDIRYSRFKRNECWIHFDIRYSMTPPKSIPKGIDMGQLTTFRYVSQKPSLYAYAGVSSWWSKIWSCLYLH